MDDDREAWFSEYLSLVPCSRGPVYLHFASTLTRTSVQAFLGRGDNIEEYLC